MSKKVRFTPEMKESIVIDYIEGNKPRNQMCKELHISKRTFTKIV